MEEKKAVTNESSPTNITGGVSIGTKNSKSCKQECILEGKELKIKNKGDKYEYS